MQFVCINCCFSNDLMDEDACVGKVLWYFACKLELGGMTKNLYHGIFLNCTGFTVYDGIFFFHA